jgi:hypothetical protein
VSSRVKVVNSIWNGSGVIKRKVAQSYVDEGRAEWVEQDQLRLVLSHWKNQAAAARARAWEAGKAPSSEGEIARTLALFGTDGLAACDHVKCRFEEPRELPDRIGPVRQRRPSSSRPTIGRYSNILPKFPLIREGE